VVLFEAVLVTSELVLLSGALVNGAIGSSLTGAALCSSGLLNAFSTCLKLSSSVKAPLLLADVLTLLLVCALAAVCVKRVPASLD